MFSTATLAGQEDVSVEGVSQVTDDGIQRAGATDTINFPSLEVTDGTTS